jgi:hypothetical protein
LASNRWILRSRIRERLETAGAWQLARTREGRSRGIQRGIHRLNSGLADLGRLSGRKGKARENLRVGGPRNRLV